ncbi:MAG: GIY-YIG nuclease family protein [Pseudomonadota bacterium]
METVGFVYMLQCADGSFYIGSHRGTDVETRVSEHNLGVYRNAYTFQRRPVELVWNEYFSRYDDMVARERQIKGWSRAKKKALIAGTDEKLPSLASRSQAPTPSS